MCEKRVVTAVLSGDLLRHRQECINHYFEGLWFGIMAGWGTGIIIGGIIAKLTSVW
jgi:hypothetical protein